LRLDPAYKHLQLSQEKLQAALRERCGERLRLDLSVGQPVRETPATRRESAERERQTGAVLAIEQDPFVQQVVDMFGASIDQASIAPVSSS
jgi:DNA polymerase-3 subunit gamma/tau